MGFIGSCRTAPHPALPSISVWKRSILETFQMFMYCLTCDSVLGKRKISTNSEWCLSQVLTHFTKYLAWLCWYLSAYYVNHSEMAYFWWNQKLLNKTEGLIFQIPFHGDKNPPTIWPQLLHLLMITAEFTSAQAPILCQSHYDIRKEQINKRRGLWIIYKGWDTA